MTNCIFCKIINNQIPSYKIYEDEFTYAFLDIADDYEGHTLVIPKKHCKNILDCDCDTLNKVMQTVKLISNHYINNCGFNGINLTNCNEECAEQTVNHFHIHIIPRKNGDNVHVFSERDKQNTNFNEMLSKLKI